MLRGYYAAASGMIAQQRNQEMISNNLANAQTPGFKADRAATRAFPEMLLQQMGTKTLPTINSLKLPQNRTIGSINTGVYQQETIPYFDQGPIKQTDMPTDMALVDGALPDENGGLLFAVQSADGETRYTRNGHFTVDGQGYLTTNDGLYVLDANEQAIQTNHLDFIVTPEGNVQVDGQDIPLGITYIENVDNLVKEGQDVFRLEDGQARLATRTDARYQVLQYQLESSNVDTGRSMTDMIAAYRVFEQNQRVLRTHDESLGRAVSDIAKLG